MVKYIYHDKQWSSNYDNSNTYFTGFYGDTQNQTIQESNQNFTWNFDSSVLMELSGNGNLDVLNTITASNSIITPTITTETLNLSNISIAGNIIPQTDAFQSLGSSNLRFKDLCLATHMPGTLLDLRVLTSGSSYTPTNETTKIVAHIIGGGGGGGGCCADEYSAGSGGGAGGLCLAFINNLGVGPYTYSIGSLGTAGTSNGGNGGNGGNTSLIINGTTYMGMGGLGGIYAASSGYYTFGEGGSSSNGIMTVYGENGECGIGNTSILKSGAGGNSHYGRGGEGFYLTSSGSSAEGYGAGGGGGANNLTSNSQNGGSGSSGVIIIYEYA
jgi:hypothetical protein